MGTKGKKHKKLRKKVKVIQSIYIVATVLWILVIYCLRVYKHVSAIATLILAFPIFIFALGFINADSCLKPAQGLGGTRFGIEYLALGIIFVGVIFKIAHYERQHYTTAIMVAALILLILSSAQIPSSNRTESIIHHIQLILQTAALTLFIYVMYIFVACRINAYGGVPHRTPNTTCEKA